MSSSFLAAAGLGFVLGLQHAGDTDHIVAMSTLVSKAQKRGSSWLLGAAWGLGHTTTILAAGALIIGLKLSVPDWAADALESTVGGMLVLLGAFNLAGLKGASWTLLEHSHPHHHESHHHSHEHDDDRVRGHQRSLSHGHDHSLPYGHHHSHFHNLGVEWVLRRVGPLQLLRSYAVGLVHGLAGSTAIALLVLASIGDFWNGVAYLAVFGAGSIVGMAIVSFFMEALLAWALGKGGAGAARWINLATGMMSFCVGIGIILRRY